MEALPDVRVAPGQRDANWLVREGVQGPYW